MNISVITVNRNNAEGLYKTIQSVITQTVFPYEFIIIDGASTDGGVDLLKKYANYITYSVSEPDNGIYNAMNKGIAQAHGEYCIFMNSGDCFSQKDVVEKIIGSGAHADILSGNVVMMTNPQERFQLPDEITMRFLFSKSICHQAVCIKRELLADGYDESLRIAADRKFFLNALVLNNCSYQHIDVDIVNYDVTGFSAVHRLESEQEWQRVLDKIIPRRILLDYGTDKEGVLYDLDSYNQMFLEIGKRRYRKPVYIIVRGLLSFLSIVIPSARFVKIFPRKYSD